MNSAHSTPADDEASQQEIGESSGEQSASTSAVSIRKGSPFAIDPLEEPSAPADINLYELGPVRYTAMGAVVAATMVLFFALLAAWKFPGGGALVAALGCLLATFGLYSTHRKTSLSLLAIHLLLFLVSYGRTLN